MNEKTQLTRIMFLSSLSTMKKVLELGEYKFGKKSDDYKYYKKQVMDFTYEGLKKIFKQLYEAKIIAKCECKAKLRKGYSDCECGGSGYKNT